MIGFILKLIALVSFWIGIATILDACNPDAPKHGDLDDNWNT